jgi:Skp family chaperone for outer membrane proteins
MTHSSLPKLAAMVLAISCLAGTAVAQEPVKIATIDLLKAFDSYWKTKLSNDQLKERGADFDKARVGMIEDLDLLREEYNRLNVSAQDPANSDEKRAADLKKTQEKISEFKRLEQQVIDFNKNAQKTLSDQTRRLRKGRLEEIQEVISTKAKELGYDLVIDSSQDVLLPRTPTVLFTNGKNDITAVVIDILNKDAVGKYKPADPAEPAATAPEKPAAPPPTNE